jgi:hypothetical protein
VIWRNCSQINFIAASSLGKMAADPHRAACLNRHTAINLSRSKFPREIVLRFVSADWQGYDS